MWLDLMMLALLLVCLWGSWCLGRVYERALAVARGRRRAADMVNAIHAGLAAPEGEQLDRMLDYWERRRT